MARYSSEHRDALLKKLLPPFNMSVAELARPARQEGVSEQTLYNWRKHAKAEGVAVPGDKNRTEDWPAEAKLAVVIETASLSEIELSEYCRSKGLYPKYGSINAKSELRITMSLFRSQAVRRAGSGE